MADTHVDLEKLLTILSKHNVTRFKKAGLEIELKPSTQQSSVSSPPLAEFSEQLKKSEDALPPDLRADDLFNYDKVLNWSGSPDHSDSPQMPMTDDLPLTMGSP